MNEPSFSDRLIQPHTSRWFVWLFGLPMSYAIVRYHIVGGVDWSQFPLFIANKGISLAAVFFIAMSYLIGKTIKVYASDASKRGQRMGYFCRLLAAGHVLVIGFAGWLNPAGWHGHLPPISMIASLAILRCPRELSVQTTFRRSRAVRAHRSRGGRENRSGATCLVWRRVQFSARSTSGLGLGAR